MSRARTKTDRRKLLNKLHDEMHRSLMARNAAEQIGDMHLARLHGAKVAELSGLIEEIERGPQ